MTPDRLRQCLDLIGWSQRQLAAMLEVDERQVRRWAAGGTIPQRIADWLDFLAKTHERHPPPPRSRRQTGKNLVCQPPDR